MREAFALGGAEGERGWAPAKAATLDRLRRAGLPVPPGVVFGLDPAALAGAAVAELLALGPVIVRSALAFEDQASSSGAGLGRSIGGLRTLAAVQEATQEIAAEAAALRASGGAGEAEDAVIVQAQVDGRALAVLARESTWPPLLEVFSLKKKEDDRRASLEVLSVGGSPGFSGALDDWRDPAAAAIAGLWPAIEAVVCAAGGPEGFEAELVIDAEDRVWVVQARPLTRSLLPGFFSDFLPALVAAGAAIPGGRWALDAEHNPAPLSPAHAWLIGWLGLQRPGQRRYCVLAGWLYREVAAASARARATDDAQGEAPRSAISALRRLLDVEIPAARRRLGEIEALLAEEAVLGEAAFVAGEGALLAVVDAYTSLSRWARRADATTSAAASAGPRCLVDRRRFADVLPTAWDVASPTLAEVQPELSLWTEERKQGAGPVVDEEEAGLLLGELDDHLFALGLAPWRRLYLRAAALLGVDKASIFSWTPPELRRVLRAGAVDAGDAAALVERGAQARLHAALRPPAFLAQGRPLVSAPTRWMRGLGIGARAAGVVAQRRDLEELLKDPPAAGAIVVLPALTAQAALAIAHLGVCAVVTAYGGALSHGALIARELGLSALLGCRGCLEVASGTPVIVDTQTGWLRLQDG
jgi:phosphohistidine swiveling domain-containing protein